MARSDFYKGKRKRRNTALIPTVILLSVLALIVVMFYAMQKYAVITRDGVSVELPLLKKDTEITLEDGAVSREFDVVDVRLSFDDADHSQIPATAGMNVKGLRAIFVPQEKLYSSFVDEYLSRLNTGNALVFDMKPRSGNLNWFSESATAALYGLSVYNDQTTYMPDVISMVKSSEANIYLVAQISCLIDSALPSRCNTAALTDARGGYYSTPEGIWLDPYSDEVVNYIAELVKELYAMGFDEVVLADVMHPALQENEAVNYTTAMSTPPTPYGGVSAFVLKLTKLLEGHEGALSIYVDSNAALTGIDTANGQDGPLFFRLFDRVYMNTDRYAYNFQTPTLNNVFAIGTIADRFVPVVQNYLPDNPKEVSWVLVDVETKK